MAAPDWDLDDLYDERTLGALEGRTARRPIPPAVVRGWRGSLGAGAIVTATVVGTRDVLEPERKDPIVEEVDVDSLGPPAGAPVVYHHVPGLPKASRAVVRPWLL